MNSDSGSKKKPVVEKNAGAIMGMNPSDLLNEGKSSVAEKPTQWPGPNQSEQKSRHPVPKEERWEGALAPSGSVEKREPASLDGVNARKEDVWTGALQSRENHANINVPLMPFDPKEFKAGILEAGRQNKPAPTPHSEFPDILGQGCERDDLMDCEESGFCVPLEDEEQPAPQAEVVVEAAPRPVVKTFVPQIEEQPQQARPLVTRRWFQIMMGSVCFGAGAAFAHFALPRLLALLY